MESAVLKESQPDIIKRVQDSVVDIQTDNAVVFPFPNFNSVIVQFFKDFFETKDELDKPIKFKGQGSGVIIDSSGLILTNDHVVSNAQTVKVVLNNKKSFSAQVIGKNEKEDLALVKINVNAGVSLSPIVFGDSDLVKSAEEVYAIGTPFGYSQSVSRGIISAVHRELKNATGEILFPDLIQTDAEVNPGNSGGPLLNIEGEMIGIVSITDKRAARIHFAIPVNRIKPILQEFKTHEQKNMQISKFRELFGLSLTEQKNEKGENQILISEVAASSKAKKAGIQPGDILTQFEKKPLRDLDDLLEAANKITPKQKIYLQILKNNRVYFTYLEAKS